MEPGERKSATFRDVLRPVEDHERKLRALSDSEIRRLEERRKLEEAELEEIRRRAAKCEDSEKKSELKQQAEELALNITVVPPVPQMLTGDVTPEKLVSLCFQNGGRIAQADAEGLAVTAPLTSPESSKRSVPPAASTVPPHPTTSSPDAEISNDWKSSSR